MQDELENTQRVQTSAKPSSWSLSEIIFSWQNSGSPVSVEFPKFDGDIVYHGLAISVVGFERWTLTLTSQKLTLGVVGVVAVVIADAAGSKTKRQMDGSS